MTKVKLHVTTNRVAHANPQCIRRRKVMAPSSPPIEVIELPAAKVEAELIDRLLWPCSVCLPKQYEGARFVWHARERERRERAS